MLSDHCGLLTTPAPGATRYRLQWKTHENFAETLPRTRHAVHSDGMSNSDSTTYSGGGPFYWCLRHNRVETDQDVCPASMTMGPYRSSAEAEQAVARVAKRQEQLDAEDAQWRGDQR